MNIIYTFRKIVVPSSSGSSILLGLRDHGVTSLRNVAEYLPVTMALITGDLNFQQQSSREPQNTMQLVEESQSFRRYKAILQQSTGPGVFR